MNDATTTAPYNRLGSLSEHGFTLIEMIVVLAVLALVGSIVLARGPSRSPILDLRAATRSLASGLRETRSHAINSDRDLMFTVDPIMRDYGEKGGPRQPLPAAISVAPPSRPVVFHSDGSSAGGAITLIANNHTLVIRIDWLTGRVSVR